MPSVEILEIQRPDQLKALGHPLRLRVLEVLGENDEELTNRELAQRLGVDPGHLHFHVRMLLNAGLIELVDGGRRREKPYRAVAASIKVAPELIASGAADDARLAMLDEVRQAHASYTAQGRFRSSQLNVRVGPDEFLAAWKEFVERVAGLEEGDQEPLTVTMFWHPRLQGHGEEDVVAQLASAGAAAS